MYDEVAVDILLAVFNGEKYLDDQLQSLICQANSDFRILIRNDVSSDKTSLIILRYIEEYKNKIIVVGNNNETLGARGNFARLLESSLSDYIMFCDQDDIWLPHKIEITLARMKQIERQFGKYTPLLVHTDLKVVDEGLNEIAGSLWRYHRVDPASCRELNRLLVQNPVTGCTVMINKALRDMALPIPPQAMMHDWWLALIAAAFGAVDYVAEATALYRQHGKNVAGARLTDARYLFGALARLEDVRNEFLLTQRQAAAFLERFATRLSPAQKEMVECYASLNKKGLLQRRYTMLQYRFFNGGMVRDIGRFLLM